MKTHVINFTAYEVSEANWDGTRDNNIIGYFEHYSDAKECESSDVQFRQTKQTTVNITYKVFESLAEFYDNKNEAKRQHALSKLTAEEKELLGLST
jgi:hypothetical protein